MRLVRMGLGASTSTGVVWRAARAATAVAVPVPSADADADAEPDPKAVRDNLISVMGSAKVGSSQLGAQQALQRIKTLPG